MQIRVQAVHNPQIPVQLASNDDYLCLDDKCLPVADWFDSPISPRPKKRSWAMQRRFRKIKPSWAQLFARDVRERMSALSPSTVTIIGAFVNIVLAVLKLSVGSLVGCASLLADGWHSFGDLVSDVICWVANKVGAREPTKRHPGGFAKYEHMMTLCIACIIASGGLAMTWSSSGALLAALRGGAPALMTTTRASALVDVAALAVAVASVASKEMLFGVTHAIGLRCRSPAVIANAYHHRSDALSSLIAIVGIVGGLCGCTWLDPLAATAVGCMVMIMGRDVARESLDALTAGEQEEQAASTAGQPSTPRVDATSTAALSPSMISAVSGAVRPSGAGRPAQSRSTAPRMLMSRSCRPPSLVARQPEGARSQSLCVA